MAPHHLPFLLLLLPAAQLTDCAPIAPSPPTFPTPPNPPPLATPIPVVSPPLPRPFTPGSFPSPPGPAPLPSPSNPVPQPGPAPGQPGPAPGQPGPAPGQPGPAPGQPGPAPGQPGPAPGRSPGPSPSQPAPTPPGRPVPGPLQPEPGRPAPPTHSPRPLPTAPPPAPPTLPSRPTPPLTHRPVPPPPLPTPRGTVRPARCQNGTPCTVAGSRGVCDDGVCVRQGGGCSRDGAPCSSQGRSGKCLHGECYTDEGGTCTGSSCELNGLRGTCTNGRCIVGHDSCSTDGGDCFSNGQTGTCDDGRCVVAGHPPPPATCLDLGEGAACVYGRDQPGKCVAGRCEEAGDGTASHSAPCKNSVTGNHAPNGAPCYTVERRSGICRDGVCVKADAAPCTEEDLCQGCTERRSGAIWIPLRSTLCWYSYEQRTCTMGTAKCRAGFTATPAPPTDKPYGGPSSVYGQAEQQEVVTGVEWQVRAVMLSSVQHVAEKCIDEDLNTECQSKVEGSPWLLLDLGELLPVGAVTISSPGGWCGQKLVCGTTCGDLTCGTNPGFQIRVGSHQCFQGTPCALQHLCATHMANTGEVPHLTVRCSAGPITARFVQLLLPGTSVAPRNIQVAEVKVFAPEGMDYVSASKTYGSQAVAGNYYTREPAPPPPNSFRPPDQETTDDYAAIVIVVLICTGFLVLLVGAVLWSRRGDDDSWSIRTTLFAVGLLRIYDWVTDFLFFLYVSAVPDLGSVNNYSVAAMVIMCINLGLECARLGWAVYGSHQGNAFFWGGATVVLVLQVPASLLTGGAELSYRTYHSRMRDRWDWATHLVEDIPQITLALAYAMNRDWGLTSLLSLGVSLCALLGSIALKIRRKIRRDNFLKLRHLRKQQLRAGIEKKRKFPVPGDLPQLEFIPPAGKYDAIPPVYPASPDYPTSPPRHSARGFPGPDPTAPYHLPSSYTPGAQYLSADYSYDGSYPSEGYSSYGESTSYFY